MMSGKAFNKGKPMKPEKKEEINKKEKSNDYYVVMFGAFLILLSIGMILVDSLGVISMSHEYKIELMLTSISIVIFGFAYNFIEEY